MSTLPAAVVTMLVLLAVGLLPAAALSGLRPVTIVLAPLGGSVVAAFAASLFVLAGWTFLSWFVALAIVLASGVAALWVVRPKCRPRASEVDVAGGTEPRRSWVVWLLGAAGVLVACIWSLRGLGSPTVGFDARAVWLLRAGWFLEPHRQVIINFTSADLPLVQTSYPPLVSATASVARSVSGNDSVRLSVVVTALLNTCTLAAAAIAVCDAGRLAAARLFGTSTEPGRRNPEARTRGVGRSAALSHAPAVVGAGAAVLLVLVAFGVTEPFMTNGYADPIWSLGAVGVVAYGLQLPLRRVDQGIAVLLVLVAGLSKNEGVAVASTLAVLIALRALIGRVRDGRGARWWPPVVVLLAELAAIASWPLIMRHIHARGVASPSSPVHEWPHRARATYDGLAPYLHVLVLAVPLAVVAAVAFRGVRRAAGFGNDAWAWAGLAAGLVAIGGAFVVGNAAIAAWLQGTVHRVSEFPALAAWWIVALWAIVAAGAAIDAWRTSHLPGRGRSPTTSADTRSEARRDTPEPAAVAPSSGAPVG